MNKEELSAMVADILKTMAPEPAVKAAPYRPTAPEPTQQDTAQPDSFVPDITKLDLRPALPDGESGRPGRGFSP